MSAVVIELRDHQAAAPVDASRTARAERLGAGTHVRALLEIARTGLPAAFDPDTGEFAQTVRATDEHLATIRREGTSLRYAAIAALGLARLDPVEQRAALSAETAADLAGRIARRAQSHPDPGVVALAAWAVAEISGRSDAGLFARMGVALSDGRPVSTVELSWMLIASTAVPRPDGVLTTALTSRLLDAQQDSGIFPHVVPARSQSRWRRHVGSFADQVYPIQALARAYRMTGDPRLLAAAERCAARICELQGPAGQWWWHYDARTGDVVERFPVYSVHQHAMAPMALFDLHEAGGTDRSAQIVRGVGWMSAHPEVDDELEAGPLGVIWRKVGRREPRKLARRLSAVTTSIRPGMLVPGLDRMLPADRIDHECRPYELGWLLHAWLPVREANHA